MPEGPPRSEIQKKFWQGESMVDERIVAILPHRESIIDAMPACLVESVAVVHVILISWALVDSRERAAQSARARDGDAQLCAAHARVRPQQLVSNSRNPPLIERGSLIFVSLCSN
jgi:hypothetical protein